MELGAAVGAADGMDGTGIGRLAVRAVLSVKATEY